MERSDSVASAVIKDQDIGDANLALAEAEYTDIELRDLGDEYSCRSSEKRLPQRHPIIRTHSFQSEDAEDESEASISVISLPSDSGEGRERLFGVSIFLCFLLTLGIFPGLAVLFEPKWMGRGAFQSLLVLTFNCGDLFGRLAAGFFPIRSARQQCIYASCRFFLAPLFMIGDLRGGRLPDLVPSDLWPIFLIVVLGVTNGHLATQAMVLGCRLYSTPMMNLSMNAGLAAGGLLSNIFTSICCQSSLDETLPPTPRPTN